MDDILSCGRKEGRGKQVAAPVAFAAWRGMRPAGGSLCLAAVMLLLQPTVSLAGATGALDQISGWYPAGSSVTVTATAGLYSTFRAWAGDTNACTIAGRQITVPASGARDITAVFVLEQTVKGTAELWLSDYGITNGTPEQAELLDSDGDGVLAWQEYIAGTDPTSRNDYLKVVIASFNGMPVARFKTIPPAADYCGSRTRYYALEQLSNLMSTNWSTVPAYSNLPATGLWLAFTNSASTNMSFYRAKTWLQ